MVGVVSLCCLGEGVGKLSAPTSFLSAVRQVRYFPRNVKLLFLSAAFSGLSFGVFQFLFNFYILSLSRGYDEQFIGTLQTVSSLGAIMVALPIAWLVERWSPRKALITGAVLSVSSVAGVLLFESAAALLFFRMLGGMSIASQNVARAPFLMRNTSDDDRQWVFSFSFGLMTIAGFVGNLLGGQAPTWVSRVIDAGPTDTISYRLAMALMALLLSCGLFPLFSLRESPRKKDVKPARIIDLLREHGRTLIRLLTPPLIIGLGAGTMMPFMNIYFRNIYEKPDPPIAMLFAIGAVGMAIGQFFGPPLVERLGKIKSVLVSQYASVPFLILLGSGAYLVPTGLVSANVFFYVAAFAYIMRLALMNLANPIYQTFMLETVSEDAQALTMSLSAISFQFGWFLMPQISGWLQVKFEPFGFVYVFSIVVALYLLGTTMQWVLFGRE